MGWPGLAGDLVCLGDILPICGFNNSSDPLLDPVEVKKHVNSKERLLAAWFFILITGMVLSGFIGSYVWKSAG